MSGIAKGCIKKWVDRYNSFGLEGLMDLPRSGQPKILPPNKEAEFKLRVCNGPTEQDEVSVFDGKFLQKILEHEFDVKYTLSGVYSLLERIGLKRKMPRPSHEKKILRV